MDFVLNEEALRAAAKNGHEAVVWLFLEKGAQCDGALRAAAENDMGR